MGIDHEAYFLVLAAAAVAWLAGARLAALLRRRPAADRRRFERATLLVTPFRRHGDAVQRPERRRPGPVPCDRTPFSGRVLVIDGDTLVVNRRRIRLHGIDAPEPAQRGGDEARAHLVRLAGGSDVRVVPLAVDGHDRIVATVWRGEIDLSDRMVRDGFARATDRWGQDYAAAELDARHHRRGLWSEDAVHGIAANPPPDDPPPARA